MLPDLVITEAEVIGSPIAGGTVELQWTGSNSGDGTTLFHWTDKVYLSDDNVLDGNDILLGDVGIESPLGIGATYTENLTITLPTTRGSAQYLLVETDGSDNQGEANETNNLFALAIHIAVPDLEVEATAPQQVSLGEEFTFDWTVNNLNETPALANWTDAVYVSDDAILDEGDTLLLSTSSLGESYNNSSPIIISQENGIGSKYLLVVTDVDNQQQETTESNNIAVLQVELLAPDLEITSVTAPLSVAVGDSVSVSWTVTNREIGTGNEQWSDHVYLSQDEVLDSSDLQLINQAVQQAPLEVDGEYTQTGTVSLGLDLIPGDYHLLFITDRNNQQIETIENNNLLAVDLTVEPPPHADLIVEAITVPSSSLSGEEIEVIWRVRNQGTDATNRVSWLDSIYLSSDEVLDTFDTQLGLISHSGAIAADRTYINTARVELPDGISGDYYILVRADQEDGVYEYLFEENNLGVSGETIAVTRKPDPDLQITSLTVPETVQAGETYTISWELTNSGEGIVEDDWQDQVYLTDNGVIDNSSILLATEFQVTSLAVDENLNTTTTITIPFLANGDYEIVVVTDRLAEVFEGDNEDNNQDNLTIIVANPDLVPTILISPETATSGSSVSLSWLVENQGIGPAQGGWTESVYLSNDEVLDEKDILLEEFTRAGSLAPNNNYSILQDVTIPISARGSQYLLIATDTGNIVAEVNQRK